MHDYLRAVGFSKISQKRELQRLLDMVMGNPDHEFVGSGEKGGVCGEKSRDFIRNAGITVRGEYDDHDMFIFDYFFPHYRGRMASMTEDVQIEKLAEREEYDGVCDIVGLGVSMIFHMNRMSDYTTGRSVTPCLDRATIVLSALSISGKVLIPFARTEGQKKQRRRETEMRNGMIAAARAGDQEAIENLTIDDLDMYTSIAKRLRTEDVLTIVESYFMPYGISCDQYSVMGDILDCEEVYNQLTGERLYQMLVDCNDLVIDLCINAEDLLGEPAVGRRFRGTIWLQGQLEAEI